MVSFEGEIPNSIDGKCPILLKKRYILTIRKGSKKELTLYDNQFNMKLDTFNLEDYKIVLDD